MIERHPNERLAVLEQKFEHLEDQMQSMARKVDEMHSVLLQAKGFKIPFVVIGTAIAGAMGAISHWIVGKFG